MSVVKYGGLTLDTVGEKINGLSFPEWLKAANAEDKIKQKVDPAIKPDGTVVLTGITITENGVTTAPPDTAYVTVVTSVPEPTLTDLAVTENGEYTGRYRKVTVNVPTTSDAYITYVEELEQIIFHNVDISAD